LHAFSLIELAELMYLLHTSRVAIYLTSAPPILRRATRTAKCFDIVPAKPKDRLRCTAGLSKIALRIGYPEEQRSRSFASHLEHGKGTEHRARLQDGTFNGVEISESSTASAGIDDDNKEFHRAIIEETNPAVFISGNPCNQRNQRWDFG
jgi:hypothetical protein